MGSSFVVVGTSQAPSTVRPFARDPRVLIGWPLPLGFGLGGRLLLARRRRIYVPFTKRSEIAGSVGCWGGLPLLAEAVPRLNSRMDSCAPRIQPSVLREDRIAARLARVMYRFRDCHQIERMIIHSDGGIDIRFRDPRPDHAHSSRSAVAHVGSMGPTTSRARPALSPRQVKKNKRAADHQAALAAVAASRSTSSTTNGVPPSVPSDGASTATPAPGDPPVAETGGDTDAMCVDVSSPAVDPVPQHEGVAATGAPRSRKRTEAELASPPPIAQARRGGLGPSPTRPCASDTMGGPSTAVFVPSPPPLPPPIAPPPSPPLALPLGRALQYARAAGSKRVR